MNRQHGLTLVELMVTLAVAIILVAVGMPLFSGVAANNRAVTQANTFLTAFKLTRSEAIKRATEVSVCAVANPTANPIACGGNSDWVNGLMVFTDSGTAGSVDGSDVRIKVFPLTTAGATATTTGAFVRYQAQGAVETVTADATMCSTSSGCIELGQTEASGGQLRCLYIMASGQVRLQRGACS